MLTLFRYIHVIIFAFSLTLPTTQLAMIVPASIGLQKTLLTATYLHTAWYFAQKCNWLPKSFSWTNRYIKNTKKNIKNRRATMYNEVINLLPRKDIFLLGRKMCDAYNNNSKIAEKNSLTLMLLPLSWNRSIVKPLLLYKN
ncbi:MAG TPA: hypothetical protein VL201_01350 [Patescibacteria group bacterium]|jgi:hypothetical protein|nr:hypothetical protein [Patescibacteria group bacterium]